MERKIPSEVNIYFNLLKVWKTVMCIQLENTLATDSKSSAKVTAAWIDRFEKRNMSVPIDGVLSHFLTGKIQIHFLAQQTGLQIKKFPPWPCHLKKNLSSNLFFGSCRLQTKSRLLLLGVSKSTSPGLKLQIQPMLSKDSKQRTGIMTTRRTSCFANLDFSCVTWKKPPSTTKHLLIKYLLETKITTRKSHFFNGNTTNSTVNVGWFSSWFLFDS